MKAYFIKELNRWRGNARLFRLEPPYSHKGNTVEYVVVSAVIAPDTREPETYIFQSNKDGKVTDWGELTGSYRGGLNQSEALRGMGYKTMIKQLVEE